ncbi:MAG: response regulator transcription factor [Dehalococcoidales bacterium]|nr:response regulator transcription factor [Dehalococcoidales bacterium]
MPDIPSRINLCWIEEQELFQKLYSAIFTPDSPVNVVCNSNTEFSDFDSVHQKIISSRPDVFMVGCKYISKDLLKDLSKLQSQFPRLGVVLLASILKYDDLILIKQHIESTRSPFGFLFKKSLTHTEQLFSIISLVNMGQQVIDPTLSNLMLYDRDRMSLFQGLTPREMEILNLIAKGYTNTAISEKLWIDVKTVRHHINNVYSKLQTTDKFDNRHPRVSATNAYLRLTGQLTFEDDILEE